MVFYGRAGNGKVEAVRVCAVTVSLSQVRHAQVSRRAAVWPAGTAARHQPMHVLPWSAPSPKGVLHQHKRTRLSM